MVSMTDDNGNMPKDIAKDIISRNNLVAIQQSRTILNHLITLKEQAF